MTTCIEKHSTAACEEITEEKVSLLNQWYKCRSPVFFKKRAGLGKTHFVSGLNVMKKPPRGGLEVTQSNHGRCADMNMCFRSDHHWSCDLGTGQNDIFFFNFYIFHVFFPKNFLGSFR